MQSAPFFHPQEAQRKIFFAEKFRQIMQKYFPYEKDSQCRHRFLVEKRAVLCYHKRGVPADG
jgi:hypothetical protein